MRCNPNPLLAFAVALALAGCQADGGSAAPATTSTTTSASDPDLNALLNLAWPGAKEGCVWEGDPAARVRACTVAIESGKYSGDALATVHVSRAVAYSEAGDHKREIADYGTAIRLAPNDPLHYSNRGGAYSKLGEYDRAMDDFDQALRLDPGNAFVYFNRGGARCRHGEIEASVGDLMRAFTLDASLSKDFHADIRSRGVYRGDHRRKYGVASKKDLQDWVERGCP